MIDGMWEDFEFGGKAWRRLPRGPYEAQVCADGESRAYRITHRATGAVVLYGVSSLSAERTERFLEAALGVIAARLTAEIPVQR